MLAMAQAGRFAGFGMRLRIARRMARLTCIRLRTRVRNAGPISPQLLTLSAVDLRPVTRRMARAASDARST